MLSSPRPRSPAASVSRSERGGLDNICALTGLVVAAVGGLIILGWATGEIIIPSAVAAAPAVKLNTGVCFLLAGGSLALRASGRLMPAARLMGAATAAIGVLTLCEYVFATDLGIDQIAFDDGSISVGRMAPNTAIGFSLLGAALVAMPRTSERWQATELLASGAGMVGWLGLLGFAADVPQLVRIGGFLQVALPTAAMLAAAGFATALTHPPGHLRELLASDGPAGPLVRKLLAVALVVPLAVALLLQAGHRADVLDEGTVILLLVALLVLSMLVVALRFARSLDAAERERLRTERIAEASEARFRRLLEAAPDAMVIVDGAGAITMLNAQSETLFGYTREELSGQPVEMLIPPRLRDRHVGHRGRFLAHPAVRSMGDGLELSAQRKDGTEVPVEISLSPIEAGSGSVVLASIRDVSIRKRMEAVNRRLAAIVQQTDDAVFTTDLNGIVTDWNRGAEVLYGYMADEAVGQPLDVAIPSDHPVDHQVLLERALRGDAVEQHEAVHLRKDGSRISVSTTASPLRDELGDVVGVSGIVRDVSERKRFEGQLQYLADHDSLTGLFNRRRFAEELDLEAARALRYGTTGAVLVIDLDHFKYVNDTLGHAAGDELITRVGEVLRRRSRSSDVVARVGGDEFAAILPNVDEAAARSAANHLLDALRKECQVEMTPPVSVTASIGIALFTGEEELTGEELLVEADIAMYDAKEAGRDRALSYNPAEDRHQRMQLRLGWTERIRRALAEDRFALHAQPIMSLTGDTVPRHELLIRMRGENGELVPPGAFLYVAERTDLVQDIDRWVVREAIRLLAREQADGNDVRLQINVSARSIAQRGFARTIAGELETEGVDGRGLCFEYTESAAIVNIERAKSFAADLHRFGCEFALDDFGAGFASFFYLKHLAYDFLKIDGEFIKDLTRNETDQLVVQSLVAIARGLGKRTIAEFVGNAETLKLLRQYGVDFAQGFHVAEPQPLEHVDLRAPAVVVGTS